MDDKQLLEVKEKLFRLNSQTSNYISEIKQLINTYELNEEKINIISYFTLSFSLAHDKSKESLIIGSYHIQNIGNKLLTNPYICIKLSSKSTFHFSGKYIHSNSKQLIQSRNTWKRINEQENKEEFWLKPMDNPTIQPNEIITFSNFQVKWLAEKSYDASILGFTYTDQFKEGVTAINPIYLNGT